MKFLVVTNAPTIHMNNYKSYAPYVKEMDLWFKNVDKIGILSPVNYPSKVFLAKFERQDIKLFRMPFLSFRNTKEILYFIFYFPITIFKFIKAFVWADHLHLRCPGNFGLIGSVIQIFFPGKSKSVKYAGNWDPLAKQPCSYKLQKWILSNTFLTRNMQVLVYGEWPDQTKNVVPFFTASFSENEKEIINKELTTPYKFLFVGNLVPGKQPALAIQIVAALNKRNIPAELHIYGDGQLKTSLENQTENKTYIHFQGNQSLEVLKQVYKDSHFLILASKSEGWPKAVAEAMWFGCIPVVTNVSCVSWMINYGSRGILIPDVRVESGLLDTFQKSRQFECFPETADAVSENVSRTGFSETPAYRQGRLEVTESGNVIVDTAVKIIELINNPEEMRRMSMEAQEWSQEYTLEKFEAAIKEILNDKYQTKK